MGLSVKRIGLHRLTFVVLHDVAIAALSLPIAFMLRHSEVVLRPLRMEYVLNAMPLMVVAALVSIFVVGSHRAIWRYMGVPEILRLAQFAFLAVLLFSLGQFLVDRLAGMQRSIPPLQFLVMMFLMLASRIGYGAFLRWTDAIPAATPAKPILLIGSGDGAALLVRLLGFRRHPEFEPVGILCDQVSNHRSIAGVPVLGDLADFDRVVANLQVQGRSPAQVVITRPHHELGSQQNGGYAAVAALLDKAASAGITVADLPDLVRFRDERGDVELDYDHLGIDSYPRLKRLFDIALSFLLLVFFSPVLVLSALAVAIFIQRPVIFVQRRLGLGRKPFDVYKFRTMRDPVDPFGRVLNNEERTLFLGRFLRRSRLDELPQLWNVLIGDMAIIGPRPLIRADLDAMPDHGDARSRAKPGLTGWGQVNGANLVTPEERYALDRWYAEHASLALDLRIMLLTARVSFTGAGRNEAAIAEAIAALNSVPAQ